MLKKIIAITLLGFCLAGTAYASTTQTAKLININLASAKTLQTLPRIGKVMAARIVQYRKKNGSFKSIDALAKVKGMSAKRVKGVDGLIVAGQKSTA